MAAPTAYGTLARTFHWAGAALLLFQIPLAFFMIDQPIGPDKLGNFALHKSIGLLIFALTAVRLAWRLTHPAPALPAGTATWQRYVARLTHVLLYFLLFVMPLTGWLRSSSANFPVSFFGLFTLPTIVAPDPRLSEGFEEAHEVQGFILMALIAAHALAALHHHFIRRDEVLRSMLPMPRRG